MHAGFVIVCSALLELAGIPVAAAQRLPENGAEQVARAYEYPRELPGFVFAGASADPDPRVGVSITFEHRGSDPAVLYTDVHLYRAARARMTSIGLQEGFAGYLEEIESTYASMDLETRDKPKAIEITADGRTWAGRDHAFEFTARNGAPTRSYTLVLYESGHLVKFRGSTLRQGGLSARKLRKVMAQLAEEFLPGVKVLEPFGHRCGPPEFVTVDDGDARARTFSSNGYEYYVPRGLDDETVGGLIGAAMQQSVLDAAQAQCFGDGVRIKVDGKG